MYCNATLMPLLLCFLLLSLLIDCLSLIQRISCIELILAHLQKKEYNHFSMDCRYNFRIASMSELLFVPKCSLYYSYYIDYYSDIRCRKCQEHLDKVNTTCLLLFLALAFKLVLLRLRTLNKMVSVA